MQILEEGQLATEIEIYASAYLLNTQIFVYSQPSCLSPFIVNHHVYPNENGLITVHHLLTEQAL
jgi:hypothetical protein